jgi:hypothetical protein
MSVTVNGNTYLASADGKIYGQYPLGDAPVSSLVPLESRFHPDKGDTWINWDYPRYAYPALDVDYKLTGYDWENRDLSWSFVSTPTTVNTPTIDGVSGLISWTPDATEDGSDFAFTVRLTAGSTTVDKTFTIQVRTAKFIFCDWSTGVDSPSRGAISTPYKSVRYAMTQEAIDGVGQVYMVRGGTSNESHVATTTHYTDHPLGAFTTNTADTPILQRNYPGETVTNDCQSLGSSYSAPCPYSVLYGLNCINTGTATGSGIGMSIRTQAVGKLLTSYSNIAPGANNPSPFRFSPGSVYDSCIGRDGYDRSATTSNSQDFLGFMDSISGSGDSYLIDCESQGAVDNSNTLSAFRAKHAADWDATTYQGEYNVHYHRCAATNPNIDRGSFGYNAGDTVRHCVAYAEKAIHTSNATQAEVGRPAEGSQTQALVSISQGNMFILDGVSGPGSINNFTGRFLIYNDVYVLDQTVNNFRLVDTTELNADYVSFDFQDNTFYADADSWFTPTVKGVTYGLTDANTASAGEDDPIGGQNNTREAFPGSIQKVAAGKTWTWNGSTLSGVPL